MSIEDLIRTALADNAHEPRQGPDVAELMARGVRLRRRRVATVASAVAAVLALVLVLAVTVTTTDPTERDPLVGEPRPSVSSEQPSAPEVLDRPDFSTYPQHDNVASFTAVATGVVYVEKGSARVVWESWQHERRVIGRLGRDALEPAEPGMSFGNRRDVVGNPMHDLVAWVETTGKRQGHLVVVRASTGEHLAATDVRALLPRTDVRSPLPRRVVIAALDDKTVWFAPMQRYLSGPDIPGGLGHYVPANEVRTWSWAVGEAPRVEHEGADQDVIDVSGGVWATERLTGLVFTDADGVLLSEVSSLHSERKVFASALSPDGRYWYGSGGVISTATGDIRTLSGVPDGMDAYGWTGAATITILKDGRWTSCDAATGACAPPQRCGFSYCTSAVPAP